MEKRVPKRQASGYISREDTSGQEHVGYGSGGKEQRFQHRWRYAGVAFRIALTVIASTDGGLSSGSGSCREPWLSP